MRDRSCAHRRGLLHPLIRVLFSALQLHEARARTAVSGCVPRHLFFHFLFTLGHSLCLRFLSLTFLHSFGIIGRSLPLFECDCPCRTVGQTVSEAVAEVFSHQLRLPINDVDGAFVTCLCAETAAVTLFLVDMDDLSYHFFVPFLFF